MNATQDKTRITAGLRPLLELLVDYAGLFPPAGLPMDLAVANYARYKTEIYSWMLGRFVVPVARLAEFEKAWAAVGKPSGWQLSALLAKPEIDLPFVQAFNARHAGGLIIDAIETRAVNAAEIRQIAAALPKGITAYVEIQLAADDPLLLQEIQANGLRAKIRTGGLTADLFPEVRAIAHFLRAAADASVTFKATAGLHHPLRCEKPFTYEPDSPRGTMHGFLNVFLAAAFARKQYPEAVLEQILLEDQPRAFRFDDNGVTWRGDRLSAADLNSTRAEFAIAFGSCSFEEPIADLQALGLLL